MEQLSFFDIFDSITAPAVEKFSSHELAFPVKEVIKTVARAGHPLVIAWSSGRDSSAMLNLTLTAMREMSAAGETTPPIVVLHADPLIENPAVSSHARNEIKAIQAYSDKHSLNVRIEVSTPPLASQWAVKVIGGRNLPPLPGLPRCCTVDLKITPMAKLKKRVMKELCTVREPVTLIGTRFAESVGRKARMKGRGETHEGLWSDKEGLKLSPIAHWSDDELWQYLYNSNDLEEAYGDLTNLIQLYLDGARETTTNCAGQEVPCDTRFGCMLCTVGRDKSLEGMVAKGDKYTYMKPLLELQTFIKNTRFDFDRRTWIGRSINDGYIAIGPDTYSPDMLAELLRYCLTIDTREAEAAYGLGIEPRFQIISPEALIAIDAIWSQQGIHKPFQGLRIFRDITEGARYDIPAIPVPKPVAVPEARYLWAGEGWRDIEDSFRCLGMRNIILEMTTESGTGGCMGTRTLKDGRIVLDVEKSGSEFTVDPEAAEFILGFELDYVLDTYGPDSFNPRTTGFRYYSTMGTLEFASGQVNSSDMIMRRTGWKETMGLFDMNRDELLAKTISKEDMLAKTTKPGCEVIELLPAPHAEFSDEEYKEAA